jgi:hypothetical protein
MADNRTKPTDQTVESFINTIEDERKRRDSQTIITMMCEATGEKPCMWGSSIVGFGSYHYKYESGREGDAPRIGFSPRKQNLTLYLLQGELDERRQTLLTKLGKHTTGKGCLYIKKLDDVDLDVLKQIIQTSAGQAS